MTQSADKHVLVVDMGSGSAKVALVSQHGRVVASAIEHLHTQMLPGGGVEQDPREWWSAVTAAAKATVAAAAVPAQSILAVKCTGQWSVTVPVDADGTPLHNAISWMDTRGGPYNRRLMNGTLRVAGYDVFKLWRYVKLTGGCPARLGVDGLGHILFLKNERPDVYRRTHKFLEPMDYLNFRFSGRMVASYGTMFPYWLTDNRDPNRIDYDSGLLNLAGLERRQLPDLLPVDAVVGTLRAEVASELGLLPSTRVLAGVCDGPAATVGAGTVADYQGYFYIGTSAWMSCHLPRKKTDVLHMLSTMPAALPGRYSLVAEQGMAGRCLEFLKDNVLFPDTAPGVAELSDPYAVLNQLAQQAPPGCDGLIFTPWINGVLVPADDPYTRSAFFNQSARTTRAHYARAVMEGVAFNLRWLKAPIEKFIGRRFEHLSFIGGGALSEVWCQILADVLGCPIRAVANSRYANGVGAALAAFAALGEIRVEDISGRIQIAREYQPIAANRGIYDAHFREFMELYKRLRPIYRRLNQRGS
ncbi:MAG: FGGY-family carbohydrate kinase [Deltaproteobacteria bacterium]|nr:FGGY-family carbohydrate kinase [Deltaproteobacteria bacterium]